LSGTRNGDKVDKARDKVHDKDKFSGRCGGMKMTVHEIGSRRELFVDEHLIDRMSEEPILRQGKDGKFDSQNPAFWDELVGKYRIYVRQTGPGGRDIATATSEDFLHWTGTELLSYPGAPDEELYINQIRPYYRAPHIYLGFPARYLEREWSPAIEDLPETAHRRLRSDVHERYGTALTDGLFMSSRDGRTFRRWGEAFIRPGSGNNDRFQGCGRFPVPSCGCLP
jgi:hypothetical protein